MIGLDEEEEMEGKAQLKTLWTSDPVHLSSAGYEKMARDLYKKSEGEFTRPTSTTSSKREANGPAGAPVKRARWIEEDEVTVSRNSTRGQGRGRGLDRDGGRGRGWRPRGFWRGGKGKHFGGRF
jgi:hypothetical protein